MGLTAILSSDVLDIMSRDFYEKYEEYMSVMAERKNRQLSSGLKPYSTAVTVERHQLANFIEKAVQETAEWNKKMNQDRYVGLYYLQKVRSTNRTARLFRISNCWD